jgi:hypothetical protein
MNDSIVILDERGLHLRISGDWHHGLTREQSRRLLLAAGIDPHDAYLLLESAVWWPDPVEVEHRSSGRRRWTVDGRPVTRAGAAWSFRDAGLKYDEIGHLKRIYRLCDEIERRLPPPPESMTVEEFLRLLADELARALSLRVARHWVRDHLRLARSRHPRGLSSWKQRFEHDKPRRRITQDDFARVLTEAGIKVVGDDVYCKEIRS